jgi:hypothetical protein
MAPAPMPAIKTWCKGGSSGDVAFSVLETFENLLWYWINQVYEPKTSALTPATPACRDMNDLNYLVDLFLNTTCHDILPLEMPKDQQVSFM